MGSTVLIRIMEIGLFVGIILHIVQGYMLELKNRATRKIGYEVNLGNRGSKWYSRAMGLLGMITSLGYGFAILVPLVFALMPIAMYLGWVK